MGPSEDGVDFVHLLQAALKTCHSGRMVASTHRRSSPIAKWWAAALPKPAQPRRHIDGKAFAVSTGSRKAGRVLALIMDQEYLLAMKQPQPDKKIRWRIVQMENSATTLLGFVTAPDKDTAIKTAIKQFQVPPNRLKGLVARTFTDVANDSDG